MIIEDRLTMMLNAPNFCSGVVPLRKCNLQAALGLGMANGNTYSPPVSTVCARLRMGMKVVLVRPVAMVNKKEEAADAGLW